MMKGSVQSARRPVSFLLGNVLVDQVRKIGLACLLHDAAQMQQQINGAEDALFLFIFYLNLLICLKVLFEYVLY